MCFAEEDLDAQRASDAQAVHKDCDDAWLSHSHAFLTRMPPKASFPQRLHMMFSSGRTSHSLQQIRIYRIKRRPKFLRSTAIDQTKINPLPHNTRRVSIQEGSDVLDSMSPEHLLGISNNISDWIASTHPIVIVAHVAHMGA